LSKGWHIKSELRR
jgi:hypothetical protein